MITWTWTTLEVEKAIEKGYRIVQIHEVYHFPKSTKYSPKSLQGGLFAEYVNTFLTMKQEASGWPDWCKTDTDKQT